MPLRDLGATILVIDHVQKTASRSNPYPRGAGSKLADTEVAWFVEAIEPFNRSQVGELRLTKHKDRSGVLPAEMRLKVGDGQGNLPVEVIEGAGESDGRGDKEHQLRQRVVEALREHGELNVTQLKELVKGNASQVVATARELAHDPREPVGVGTGPRQSVIYRYDAAEGRPCRSCGSSSRRRTREVGAWFSGPGTTNPFRLLGTTWNRSSKGSAFSRV
jgi:hypothetical protein